MEVQLNTWFYNGVVTILEKDLSLVVHVHTIHRSLPESLICLYGKSQPDLCFHPAACDNSIALGGIILPADNGDTVESNITNKDCVVGGVVEFKPFVARCTSQMFTNLVRYGVYLVEDRLKRGYIIEHIIVFGILASHHKGMCIPLKLAADLGSGVTKFMEGETMPVVEGFVKLVHNTINFCK